MPRAGPPGGEDRIEQPGKLRTWWHPLLTRLMDHLLSSAYTVQEEVSVGKLPLRVDMLLIRREEASLRMHVGESSQCCCRFCIDTRSSNSKRRRTR